MGYGIAWFYAIGEYPEQQISLTAGSNNVSVSADVNITVIATKDTNITIAFAEAPKPELIGVKELNITQVEIVEYQNITVSGDVKNVSVFLVTVEYPEDVVYPLVIIYKNNSWIQLNSINDTHNATYSRYYNETYGTIVDTVNHMITLNFTQIASALSMNLSAL